MANGCLDDFLNKKEARLVNLDWLDIDSKDYKNMPFNPLPEYIAIPKLEEAWRHEPTGPKLIPNSEMNFSYNLPKEYNEDKKIKDLLNFTKRQMMAGKSGKDLVEIVKANSTPELIKQAYESLKALSAEQGILGNVYITPDAFDKCASGAEYLRKTAKTAKYLIAMDKCAGCSFNKGSRCDIYKKTIASEISYTEDLFNFYSKHFANIFGKEVKVASKEDLQKIFLKKEEKQTKYAENKPKVEKDDKEKEKETLESAQKKYEEDLKGLEEALSKISSKKIERDLTGLLIKGYDASVLAKHIKEKYTKEDYQNFKSSFDGVLSKQGSLGRVYVTAESLPVNLLNPQEAVPYFRKEIPHIKFIMVNPESDLAKNKEFENICHTCQKDIVFNENQIPQNFWNMSLNKYPTPIIAKVTPIFNENPSKGLRLAYLQASKKDMSAPEKVENYDLKKESTLEFYNPKALEKEASFAPNKIIAAIEKGYNLSSIIRIAKKLKVKDEEISKNLGEAFKKLDKINKHQVDVKIKVPENVKVTTTQKDVASEFHKPLQEVHKISYDSSSAPKDTAVVDYNIKNADFEIDLGSKEKFEVSGLDTLGF